MVAYKSPFNKKKSFDAKYFSSFETVLQKISASQLELQIISFLKIVGEKSFLRMTCF
jgi:hypothetical protein